MSNFDQEIESVMKNLKKVLFWPVFLRNDAMNFLPFLGVCDEIVRNICGNLKTQN